MPAAVKSRTMMPRTMSAIGTAPRGGLAGFTGWTCTDSEGLVVVEACAEVKRAAELSEVLRWGRERDEVEEIDLMGGEVEENLDERVDLTSGVRAEVRGASSGPLVVDVAGAFGFDLSGEVVGACVSVVSVGSDFEVPGMLLFGFGVDCKSAVLLKQYAQNFLSLFTFHVTRPVLPLPHFKSALMRGMTSISPSIQPNLHVSNPSCKAFSI